MRLVLPALLLSSLVTGCVKEISSEERLERETAQVPIKDTPGAAELRKISCATPPEKLTVARDVNRNETDRVMAYIEVFDDLQRKTATFHEAMTKNPDLQYQEGSQQFISARDLCVQQTEDLRVEFEAYVRDLVDVPTVQEIKGGNTITVARLDFNTLRQAIESLAPDDKDLLLSRVATAEKRIAAAEEAKRKK